MSADLIIEDAAEPVVSAPGDWYVSLFAGGVWTGLETVYDGTDVSVDFDLGYSLGIAVGTHVFENIRGEIELSGGSSSATEYHWDNDDTAPAEGSLTTLYLLGNLWYELDVGGRITPYIGGGIGAGYATADINYDYLDQYGGWGPGDGGIGFAYQLGFGATVDVAEGIALDLGYRYKSIVGVDFEDVGPWGPHEDGVVSSHVLQAGLTFEF
jgi:opacity protein-like surface antigen